MKLLFCDMCFDVFKLELKLRSCKCGRVKGQYLNGKNAVVNGNGYSLAIGNGSLIFALRDFEDEKKELEHKEYIKRFKFLAWARPHEGKGNTNTAIKEDL